jgi:predicted ferric reductase
LALTSKVTEGLVSGPIAYGLHESLSLGTILFALLHALVLLGDAYIKFNLLHLIVPYTAPYAPFWTGLGTIAFYLIFVLTGSFYIRKQIGPKTWRALHYLTFTGYLLALGHGLMAGTDTSLATIKLMYLGTGFSVLFLSYYRLFTLKTRPVNPGQ